MPWDDAHGSELSDASLASPSEGDSGSEGTEGQRVRWPEPLLRGVPLLPAIANTQRDHAQSKAATASAHKRGESRALGAVTKEGTYELGRWFVC